MRCTSRKVFYTALSCAASLWGGAEVCLQRTSVVSGAPVVQPRGGRQLGTVASMGGHRASRTYVPQNKQQKQRRVSFSLPRRNLGLSRGNQHSRADEGVQPATQPLVQLAVQPIVQPAVAPAISCGYAPLLEQCS